VLKDVTISSGSKELPATVTTDAANETITLKVAETIAPGRIAIHIGFDGKLLPQLRGLYLSKTAKRKYAVTQFEATSARRAFPCFDEPAMKATYDITLVIDRGDTAISNGEIVSDTPSSSGKHAIKFATTKKMSTYLVAMLVGDFECIKGGTAATPIRVCATPGLQSLGQFALRTAEASIDYFNKYYGIDYPFGKLDLIGIPDFAAGAMENAAAITFRETDLLVDEKNSSVLAQKRVAEVVAHEIAHQWFGDLVTMKWWNDIWLNEGFATFMSEKPIEAWKPEWRQDLDKPAATDVALVVDSQLSTRPIRTPAAADNGGAGFDAAITYDKTAAVLRMVEDWIGPDQFRDAIRVYLKKYSWSNAAAEDFWGVMKASSNQPIDSVLESFIDLTGVPLLHVSDTCDANGRQVTIAQERMLPQGATAPAETWMMPVCTRDGACRVINAATQTFASQVACAQPLFLSHNGAGYFLTDYSAGERKALLAHLADLSAQERISYHGNEWLLSRFNRRDLGDYLQLLRAMPRNPVERPMITAIAENLVFLDQRLVTDQNRAAWRRFVREVLRGYAPFTWDTPAGETSEQRIDRAYVLWALGYSGDRDVIAGARKVAAKYIENSASVDALIADRALRLAAVYGDEAFFNRVLEQLAKAPTPEIANRYRGLVPLFRDPKLTTHALAYIYGDQVRTQDLAIVASAGLADPSTRNAAWAEAKSRWGETAKRSPGSAGRIIAATAAFCDPESKKDVETFLTSHGTRTGQRAMSRALESIDTCIAFRNLQQQSFDRAIASK
jgi:aminopeptidase N